MKKLHALSALMLLGSTASLMAKADLTQIIDELPTEVERESARSVQATYDDLIAKGGCDDAMRAPGVVSPTGNGKVVCDGKTYKLFTVVRSLVHTANSFSDSGSTTDSLNVTLAELGKALRWTADEEYSAQGNVAKNYSRNQTESLTSRLSALRMGASGFSANIMGDSQSYASSDSRISGGGASADREQYSPWGGFINVSAGKGDRTATDLEDAFSLRGNQYTAGVDYRVNNKLIVGLLTSYVQQKVSFDRKKSVVDGSIDTTGFNVSPFAMLQEDNFYMSGSISQQNIDFDSVRAIHYASNNPNIPSVNTKTLAATSGRNLNYFIGTGYNYSYQKFSVEPYLNFSITQSHIARFTERDVNDSAFDLSIDSQDNNQTTINFGVTSRYTFTPKLGVITPYVGVEFVQLQNANQHSVASHYVNAVSQLNTMSLSGDKVDTNYMVNTIGVSSVLVGSHQKTVGGALAGGLQVFVQYKQINNLQNYSADEVTLGARYEF